MRKIKFRGRDFKTGEYAYGELIQTPYNGETVYEIHNNTEKTEGGMSIYGKRWTTVEPDSVAQLVYIDDAGKEYYEGDELIKDGQRWKVSLVMKWERD